MRENILESVHRRLWRQVVAKVSARCPHPVLHMLHSYPHREAQGGVELHVAQLLRPGDWSLVPDQKGARLTLHLQDCQGHWLLNWEQAQAELSRFSLVHLHHTRGFCDILLDHLQSEVPYVMTLHDHYSVCPRIHMLLPEGRACTGNECAARCAYRPSEVFELRERHRRMWDNARARIAFSASGIERISRLLGRRWDWKVVDQAVAIEPPDPAPAPCPPPLRVLVLGHISAHKGAEWLAELAAIPLAVEWHVLGDVYPRPPGVYVHGPYNPAELGARVASIRPHLAAHLSVHPEMYGRTVDEAWLLQLPVLVAAGAGPEERVRRSESGWVVQAGDSRAVETLLRRLLKNPHEIAANRPRFRLLDRDQECAWHADLYRQFSRPPAGPRDDFPYPLWRPPPTRRSIVTWLRRRGWADQIQRMLRACLPTAYLRTLRHWLEHLEGLNQGAAGPTRHPRRRSGGYPPIESKLR